MSKYGHRPMNWFEAIVNKMGGEKEAERFLRGGLVLSDRGWREEGAVVYLTVTSDGTTGPEWLKSFARDRFSVGAEVEQILLSQDFVPTSGVQTDLAILLGAGLPGSDRNTSAIYKRALRRGFSNPTAELACLVRVALTNQDMASLDLLSIVVMHGPITVSPDRAVLLSVSRENNNPSLCVECGDPHAPWGEYDGFAFVANQVPA